MIVCIKDAVNFNSTDRFIQEVEIAKGILSHTDVRIVLESCQQYLQFYGAELSSQLRDSMERVIIATLNLQTPPIQRSQREFSLLCPAFSKLLNDDKFCELDLSQPSMKERGVEATESCGRRGRE